MSEEKTINRTVVAALAVPALIFACILIFFASLRLCASALRYLVFSVES